MDGLSDLLARIDSLKSELDALRPLDSEVEGRVLQKFRLWWTYHSNAIEGNKLTQGETEMFLMEGLTAKGKPLKDHLDLRGHANAINFLLDLVRRKEVLTEAALRELHRVLLVESYQVPAITPDGQETTKTVALGEYKTAPNHVRTPTGETHYYATPFETPAKMQALVNWQRQAFAERTMHPAEIAARFHYEFTAIHPFDDGNGRMARLLMNLLLMQAGYPPVVIRTTERDAYLYALRQADGQDLAPFLTFIAEHVESSLDLYLKAARGEEIHEPTDLEKEIALLKMGLSHIEEPVPLTPEVQREFLVNSLEPLYAEIRRQLLSIADLFFEAKVTISGTRETIPDLIVFSVFATSPFSQEFDLASTPTLFLQEWNNTIIFPRYDLQFAFTGFKKGGLNTFDTSTDLKFRFEPLKYEIHAPAANPPVAIRHFHQQHLTKDEIAEIAQKLARFFLEVIKKKTGVDP